MQGVSREQGLPQVCSRLTALSRLEEARKCRGGQSTAASAATARLTGQSGSGGQAESIHPSRVRGDEFGERRLEARFVISGVTDIRQG
jgi:hypothetical protein